MSPRARIRWSYVVLVIALLLVAASSGLSAVVTQGIIDRLLNSQGINGWQLLLAPFSLTINGWLAVKAYELGKRVQGAPAIAPSLFEEMRQHFRREEHLMNALVEMLHAQQLSHERQHAKFEELTATMTDVRELLREHETNAQRRAERLIDRLPRRINE